MFKLAATALAVCLAVPAFAQERCAPKFDMRKALSEKHGEIPISAGVTNGNLFEVWANPKTGSWTILRTIPAGLSCIMAAGGNFETTEEARVFLGQRL